MIEVRIRRDCTDCEASYKASLGFTTKDGMRPCPACAGNGKVEEWMAVADERLAKDLSAAVIAVQIQASRFHTGGVVKQPRPLDAKGIPLDATKGKSSAK